MVIVAFVSHHRSQSQGYRSSTWKKWTKLRLQERKTRQIRHLWDIFKANRAKEKKAIAFWVLVVTFWSLDCIKKLFTARYRNIILRRYAMKYFVKTFILLPLLFLIYLEISAKWISCLVLSPQCFFFFSISISL